MWASCSRRALLKELARRGEGDRVLRTVEQANVDPDACRNLGGTGAKLLSHLGSLGEGPDTLLSFWHGLRQPSHQGPKFAGKF